MINHDYKQNAYYLIYLIRCALHNRKPAKEKLDKMDLSSVFAVAKEHSLTAMATYALQSAGISDRRFSEAKDKAIRSAMLYYIERQNIFREFEKAGIWYMPLKGIILKDYYPKTTMREMCDNDILFDKTQKDKVKKIMSDLEFKMKADDSGHDLEFVKDPIFNFEMHTELFGSGHESSMNDYYDDVKKRLLKDEDNDFGYHFSNEDFYIYMIAHERKHFYYSGTGLRSLVDTYVFLNHFKDELDREYIDSELRALGINDYEKKSTGLSKKLFNGNMLTVEEKQLLDYYIFSGAYGTAENLVDNQIRKINKKPFAKLDYLKNRIFVPISRNNPSYRLYAARYPKFYKNRRILPLLPAYRLFSALKNSRKRIFMEIKALVKF